MKRPVIVWVDEGTEEILVEEYESVSDGELTTATHMELTHDQIVPVPSDDQLRYAIILACESLRLTAAEHNMPSHTSAEKYLRAAFDLDEGRES